MCDPVTLSIAALTTAAASGGLQAYGAVKSAKAQKNQATMAANDAAANAQIARLNGQAQIDMGETNANLITSIAGINAATTLSMGEINAQAALGAADRQANGTIALAGINAASTEKIAGLKSGAAIEVADINASGKKMVGDYGMAVANANSEMLMSAAEFQSNMLENDAQDTLDAGKAQVQASDMGYAQLKSTQVAHLAANGVALDEGSSLRLLTSTDYARDVDASRIYTTAARAALGLRVQGMEVKTEAQVKGMAMKADAFGAKLSLDIDAAQGKAEAGMYAATTTAEGTMDAFNIRQGAAWTAMNARETAENYALNSRVTAASNALNTTSTAAINAMNVRTSSKMGALDQTINANNLTSQSLAYTAQASSINPTLTGVTSLAGTAAQVAGSWYSMSAQGVFGNGGSAAGRSQTTGSFKFGSGNIMNG